MEQHTLHITGMSCGHCVRAVDTALRDLAGVTVEAVQIGEATVRFDPATIAPATILATLEDEGYDATFTTS